MDRESHLTFGGNGLGVVSGRWKIAGEREEGRHPTLWRRWDDLRSPESHDGRVIVRHVLRIKEYYPIED